MTCLHNENQTKEMRTRLTCDICNYKTTSLTVLRQHKQLNHEKKIKNSKRKVCEGCSKQFNKEETLTVHMKKCHDLKTRKTILKKNEVQLQAESQILLLKKNDV